MRLFAAKFNSNREVSDGIISLDPSWSGLVLGVTGPLIPQEPLEQAWRPRVGACLLGRSHETRHDEIYQYCQSTSEAYAEVLQTLPVRGLGPLKVSFIPCADNGAASFKSQRLALEAGDGVSQRQE